MTKTHRAAAVLSAALLTVGLSACTIQDAEPSPQQPEPETQETTAAEPVDEHNAADTEFAQMMIIHHEGAIQMADLAVERAEDGDVRALAERITAAQGPEIDMMTAWLQGWGEQTPDAADMGGMDHGDMQMEGMDQDEAMAELEGLSGPEFDRRFLELMIEHHRGAIGMAETHRGDGQNPDAVALSGRVIDDQQREITEMSNLLADL